MHWSHSTFGLRNIDVLKTDGATHAYLLTLYPNSCDTPDGVLEEGKFSPM